MFCMRKMIAFILLAILSLGSHAQLGPKYNSSIQPTNAMQYFAPVGNTLFAGDCIPFFHDNTYYLYWLLDSAHHHALNGLGGHQWVLSTSKDLKTWVNQPIVLGIDEEWEKSICTGSVVYHKNKFYAFYATRLLLDGKVNEQLSYAISDDGIHFQKQKPNPFYTSAPGYSQRNFRDPKVFVDDKGIFHLFVASEKENAPMQRFRGALVHLTSADLKKWTVNEPVLTGQRAVPECPDYFLWNGWYYLIYSVDGDTYYVKSKKPYGPWEESKSQVFVENWANVVKTAEFTNNRRIAAAWIPNRLDNKDNGREIFGGNIVFREVIQGEDGILNTRFPPELIPATGSQLPLALITDANTTAKKDEFSISALGATGVAHFENIPANCRITLEIIPEGISEDYGLVLKADAKGAGGYPLRFSMNEESVSLGNTSIGAVTGLRDHITVDIIIKGNIIDVNVDNKRCIVNRTIEQNGNALWFYVKNGLAGFKNVKVFPLTN
jgi:beta-fructofuranosidase